jgi:hypothetical protein
LRMSGDDHNVTEVGAHGLKPCVIA